MSWTGISPEQWAEKQSSKLDIIPRKIALELFSSVVMKSPVDTGRFRGNWQIAIGRIPEGTLEIDDKSGVATISRADATSQGVKAGDVIFITNNLPYAMRLEDGYSKQAPAGMVGLTVQQFQQMVRDLGLELVRI